MVNKTILKWAGNKTRLAAMISQHFPADASRIIEPFAGSGAIFVNTNYRNYILADINPSLINLFSVATKRPSALIKEARAYFHEDYNTEEAYYSIRSKFNKPWLFPDCLHAALMLYLNFHCYNGLWRTNQSGYFNSPFGWYKKPYFPEAEILAFSAKYHRSDEVLFLQQDFITTMQMAGPGDVIYNDPPYIPLSATANFASYSKEPFGPAEQQRLVDETLVAQHRGATVVISNHDTPITRQLYAGADEIVAFDVQRNISCKGNGRGKAPELLAIYRPR